MAFFGFLLSLLILQLVSISAMRKSILKLRPSKSILKQSASEIPVPQKLQNDPDFQAFMAGPEGRAWKGTRDILKRRGQIPDEKYDPRKVCSVILEALQSNDDPQLDHGACVALEFKSPNGVLSSEGLDPAGYGRFLRSSEVYSSLLDFKSFEFVSEDVDNALSVRQTVQITNYIGEAWTIGVSKPRTAFFDFYLSRVGNVWLLDAILSKKESV